MPKYGVFGYPPFIHATSSLQVHSHLPPNLLSRSDFLQQSETFLHIHKIKIWKQIQFKHGVIADCVMSILKWTHIMSGNAIFWNLQSGPLFSCHPLATKGPCLLLLDWSLRWYQSLPRTCKGCKGHVWEARSWPERPPSQVVDAPSYFFPPDRLLHFLPGPCRTLFQLEGVPFPDTCPSCPLSTSISALSLSFPLDFFALEIFTLALASKGDFDATSTNV